MTGGGDELAARVEEALDRRGHLVEGTAELGELARPGLGRTGAEVAGRKPRGCGAQPLDAPGERRADDERGGDCGGCGRARNREDLHVVAHVEHHPAGEEDEPDGQQHGEERECDQLEPRRREQRQAERGDEADAERNRRDREREPDHGTNR